MFSSALVTDKILSECFSLKHILVSLRKPQKKTIVYTTAQKVKLNFSPPGHYAVYEKPYSLYYTTLTLF